MAFYAFKIPRISTRFLVIGILHQKKRRKTAVFTNNRHSANEFWFFYKQTAGGHDIQNRLHLQGGCVKIYSENSTRFYFGREEGVKMKKRVVYMLLCFMLCMASIPAAAFADSETPAVLAKE